MLSPEERRARRVESSMRWQRRNPEKVRAQGAAKRALKSGKLTRVPCEAPGCEVTNLFPELTLPEWLRAHAKESAAARGVSLYDLVRELRADSRDGAGEI